MRDFPTLGIRAVWGALRPWGSAPQLRLYMEGAQDIQYLEYVIIQPWDCMIIQYWECGDIQYWECEDI